jgi:ribonuclease E
MRTKHQVAEVTSLGLVQMTRKRVGQGLIEAFSTTCDHCQGRGIHVSLEPVDKPDFHRTKTHHHYEEAHHDNVNVESVTDTSNESNAESKFEEKVEGGKSVAIKGDRKRSRRGKG